MPEINSNTREILLTRGKVAIVDAEDYDRISQFHWRAIFTGVWYAVRNVGAKNNKRRVAMHNEVLNAPPTVLLDHKNHNGLDNRKQNLRIATQSQNRINARVSSNNTSGYKGVVRRPKRWIAQIGFQHKKIPIGSFSTAEDAARAYDAKAVELYGEFAYLNFPTKPEDLQLEKLRGLVDHAVRDAEGWVLFDAMGEPLDRPKHWPQEVDAAWLEQRGVIINL